MFESKAKKDYGNKAYQAAYRYSHFRFKKQKKQKNNYVKQPQRDAFGGCKLKVFSIEL
jgi:hypothetical protein